jgi:hypothetical protein
MPLRRREKSTASDPRQVAEELNLRLKEDKHKEVSGGEFIYQCVCMERTFFNIHFQIKLYIWGRAHSWDKAHGVHIG